MDGGGYRTNRPSVAPKIQHCPKGDSCMSVRRVRLNDEMCKGQMDDVAFEIDFRLIWAIKVTLPSGSPRVDEREREGIKMR